MSHRRDPRRVDLDRAILAQRHGKGDALAEGERNLRHGAAERGMRRWQKYLVWGTSLAIVTWLVAALMGVL